MFQENPATQNSISNRRPLFGIGINDADYITGYKVDGKMIRCPFYQTWKNIFIRCYSKKCQEKRPTYINCSICDKWFLFSNFKAWMKAQDWEGNHLDKDIINPGNKIYSPENCCFVSAKINTLLVDQASNRGKWPKGVCLEKKTGRYLSQCAYNGKSKKLGIFSTPEQAHAAYNKFKSSLIVNVAAGLSDARVKAGLLRHVEMMLV